MYNYRVVNGYIIRHAWLMYERIYTVLFRDYHKLDNAEKFYLRQAAAFWCDRARALENESWVTTSLN